MTKPKILLNHRDVMAYFPNGSSGEILDAQCSDCPLGAGWNNPDQQRLFADPATFRPCPVAFIQMEFNYKQCDVKPLAAAMNVLINKDGVCQVREQLLEIRRDASTQETT